MKWMVSVKIFDLPEDNKEYNEAVEKIKDALNDAGFEEFHVGIGEEQ